MSYPEPDNTTCPAVCVSMLKTRGANRFIVVPLGHPAELRLYS